MKKTSIIIRCKNEENWIGFCLKALHKQSYQDFEVIIVDNNSTDATLDICKAHKVEDILYIDQYLPGKALNLGVEKSVGDYLVFLSAHCIPSNYKWLEKLIEAAEQDEDIAGSYGRQLPFSSTPPDDKRDLMLTFPLEPKIQAVDHMFHNANSLVKRTFLKETPIDETVSNIEDRVWAKQIIDKGYKIAYTPEACVHHHHGLHQHGTKKSFRSETLVKVLEKVDNLDKIEFPETILKHEIVSPLLVAFKKDHLTNNKLIDDVAKLSNKLNQKTYIFSFDKNIAKNEKISFVDREFFDLDDDLSLDEFLFKSLEIIETNQGIVDSLSFIDPSYININLDYIQLSFDLLYEEFTDFVIPAYKDFSSNWLQKSGYIERLNASLDNKETKEPVYRAAVGIGSCFRASAIRARDIFNKQGCLLPFEDYLLGYRDIKN